jgi:membrane protease YdiL (CAAX protease family)
MRSRFYLCMYLGGWIARILIHFTVEPEPQSTVMALQSSISLPWIVIFGVVSIILAPIMEEILFRGILYPMVRQLGYPKLALWGTSILFAASHANLQAFVPLTVLALGLTWLYERTNYLIAPILAHSTFNAINYGLTIHFGAFSATGS